MPKARGLGRGLSELIPEQVVQATDRPEEVPLGRIHPNAQQPRRRFEPQALGELAASIAEHGLVQPIVVRPAPDGWEIVAGERRFRAATMAGLDRLPVVVRDVDDNRMLEIALIENLQREDLTVWEEATAIRALMQRGNLTQEEVAGRLGRSRSHVANILRVLALPESVQPLVAEGRLTLGQVKALLEAPAEILEEMASAAADEGWSVRTIEARVAARTRTAWTKEPEAHGDRDHGDDVEPFAERAAAALGQPVRWRPRRDGGDIVIRCSDQSEAERLLRYLAERDSVAGTG